MELLVILKNPVLALGSRTVRMLMELGRITLFFSNGFILLFFPPLQISKIKQQIFFFGMKSLFVICLTGAFAGMLVGIQGGDIKFKLKFIDLQQLSRKLLCS